MLCGLRMPLRAHLSIVNTTIDRPALVLALSLEINLAPELSFCSYGSAFRWWNFIQRRWRPGVADRSGGMERWRRPYIDMLMGVAASTALALRAPISDREYESHRTRLPRRRNGGGAQIWSRPGEVMKGPGARAHSACILSKCGMSSAPHRNE